MASTEKYLAKTLKGLESLLVKELQELGAEDVEEVNRGAFFRGGRSLMYKVNLASRLSLRVLLPVMTFEAGDPENLYRKIKQYDWSRILDPKMTFAVDPVVHSTHFRNSYYAAQKAKDAIVDRIREKTHLRPSVNREEPDLLINLHISDRRIHVSLDSSGDSLHKRGYRRGRFGAPLNEVLAAGMILMTGWKGETPFLDPMCGSGTLAIEAALIAAGIPPGFFRHQYGFMNWKDFDRDLLDLVVRNLEPEREVKVPILARDIDPHAIRITRNQLTKMDLNRLITAEQSDFASSTGLEGATIVINPPYGERLRPDDIGSLYEMIGSTLKHRFPGSDAWILSSSRDALKRIGLKPASRKILYNGSLECSYVNFKTFQGKWKEQISSC